MLATLTTSLSVNLDGFRGQAITIPEDTPECVYVFALWTGHDTERLRPGTYSLKIEAGMVYSMNINSTALSG
jgi:hypothetical protein